MNPRFPIRLLAAALTVVLPALNLSGAETFRVATYNVESYLDAPTPTRPAKSAAARDKVRESICALKPDVLALQEMGGPSALDELRQSLKAAGLDFPYWEFVAGADTNIHVAVLSKFPFAARRPHTNDDFLLGRRRYWVSRGFGEVVVAVSPKCSFTLITAHLKSRRAMVEADEAEVRLEEAKLLREKIDADFAADPEVDLIVLGDLNDTFDAPSTRTIIGRGRRKLVDTRPAERNGDTAQAGAREARNVAWTHFFGKNDTYSRIDYILLSPAMARRWVTNETCVLAMPDWGVASDHRPIVATFRTEEQ